ncbi:ring-cleaving dioxygenase, partial [Enterococcus faecalis]
NQDDIETYHILFAEDAGTPRTDMTIFHIPGLPKGTKGTNTISRTSFRVKDDAALDFSVSRFNEFAIDHGEIQVRFGKKY